MSVLLGDKRRFAAEVGEFGECSDQLRRVDLWASGRWLTCDDNVVFVPQFCMSVRDTLDWLRAASALTRPFAGLSWAETHRRLLEIDDGSREQFWFPLWGPTTDNVSGHLFREGDSLSITLEFWRETHEPPEEQAEVFVSELPETEFVSILEQMINALGCNDRI